MASSASTKNLFKTSAVDTCTFEFTGNLHFVCVRACIVATFATVRTVNHAKGTSSGTTLNHFDYLLLYKHRVFHSMQEDGELQQWDLQLQSLGRRLRTGWSWVWSLQSPDGAAECGPVCSDGADHCCPL